MLVQFLIFIDIIGILVNIILISQPLRHFYYITRLIFEQKMKRLKRQTQTNTFPTEESDSMNLDYVEQKRAKSKRPKSQKVKTQSNIDSEDQIIDIKKGDVIHEHHRPSFMKRWDGQSNQLVITDNQYDDMTPLFKVYWKTKSKNMKCVIFVQIGQMQFFAFQDDAILLNNITKKNLKKFSKFLMINFWYKEIELVKIDLFERNIPVLVLNQIDDPQYRLQNKIIKRQITQVITPSLYLTHQPKTHRQRLLLSIFRQNDHFGVVALQSQSNHFYIQQIKGEKSIHEIRRIINRYRPVELVLLKGGENKQIKDISKQICNPFTTQIQYSLKSLNLALDQFKKISNSSIFKQLNLLYIKQNLENEEKFTMYHTIRALQIILQYLMNFNLEVKVFGQGIFQILCFGQAKIKPIFDSQVYENLQIFRVRNQDENEDQKGTLYTYLNKCNTKSGKKQLKRWIDEPLRDKKSIKQRQQAIKQLLEPKSKALSFHSQLLMFEKLQKNTTDIYHWVIKNSQLGKLHLTNYLTFGKDYNQDKNPAVVKLKQIYRVLELFTKAQQLFIDLRQEVQDSKMINDMLQIVNIEYQQFNKMNIEDFQKIKGIPSVSKLVLGIKNKINFDQKNNYLEPREGINQIFDFQKNKIKQINEKLDEQLDYWKRQLKVDKITFISARARNQIEVPKGVIKKKYKELIYSSQTVKFQRYTTQKTNQLSQQLIQHQEILAKAYQPFMNQMILQFCSYKFIWDIYVSNIAKIDVLMSLAKVAQSMAPRCLPQFVKQGLYIKDGSHLGLLQVSDRVIPNSLEMKGQQKAIILTGPNMGGKSSLLRQTCLLAILAQIGSYVPAKEYKCIIFDQIYCRVGASDRIIEGKSTFYVQLQQTERILAQATPETLVIIDELGRGTSTYDGMAIAESTLRHLVNQIGSYVLFSTHYTPITQSFVDNPKILPMKIGYLASSTELQFTYQIEPGVAEKSFANNVAKMVGIKEQIIQKAAKKAEIINEADSKMNDVYFSKIIGDLMKQI